MLRARAFGRQSGGGAPAASTATSTMARVDWLLLCFIVLVMLYSLEVCIKVGCAGEGVSRRWAAAARKTGAAAYGERAEEE